MSKPYDRLGGKDSIQNIVQSFYDRVFDHPVLSQFFVDTIKEQQVSQFTDFMVQVLGGPKMYMGREPKDAHPHLMIEQEHFDLRHYLLQQTLIDHKLEPELMALWLKVDASFRDVLVKTDISQCEKRFNADRIIAVFEKKVS